MFLINKNFAVKEKSLLTDDRINLNQRLISQYYKGHENQFNKLGKKKKDWENYLNESFLNRLKKRKSIKNKSSSFFNDYKNLSLILIYTLLYRRNTYFFTSDIDVFCNLFTWVDSMAHQMTFKTVLLNKMEEKYKMELLKDKKLVFYINHNEFDKQCTNILGDLLEDNWKKKRFSLFIKYWDPKKQIFYNKKIKISFNESIRDLLLNNHANFWCPFAANNTHGNFFKYQFYWPPDSMHDINTIKVCVRKKELVHYNNTIPPTNIHKHYCRYKRMEEDDDNLVFQSFRIGG